MSRSGINAKIIGITMGDPSGIGPEVTAKAFLNRAISSPAYRGTGDLSKYRFILIGDRRTYQKFFKRFPNNVTVCDIPLQAPCPMGKFSSLAGRASLQYLEKAVQFIKNGVIDALVTAPLSKEAVSQYQKDFRGHTEYLAHAFGAKRFDMMFVSPHVRITLVTRHVPLKDVPGLITKKAVLDSITLMEETLRQHFHVRRPRIAVWGLNPHAGEKGLLGHEDARQILPAIRLARRKGIQADGPFPADTFFCHDKDFDGIVAMYHDQGLTPVKGMYFKELVNFTAGLPFVRTSPVHGTAFDIAGRGIADPSSMIAAIELACRLT